MSNRSRLSAAILATVVSLTLLSGCSASLDDELNLEPGASCAKTDLNQFTLESGDGSVGTSADGSTVTVKYSIDKDSTSCTVGDPGTRSFTSTVNVDVTDSHMGDKAFDNLSFTPVVPGNVEGIFINAVKNDADKNFQLSITVPSDVNGELDIQLQFIYLVGETQFPSTFDTQLNIPV